MSGLKDISTEVTPDIKRQAERYANECCYSENSAYWTQCYIKELNRLWHTTKRTEAKP